MCNLQLNVVFCFQYIPSNQNVHDKCLLMAAPQAQFKRPFVIVDFASFFGCQGIRQTPGLQAIQHSLTITNREGGMSRRQLKIGYFTLAALNSFATVFYFYYLYFLTRKVFAFTDAANLKLAALNGFVSMFAAWWGGKFGQKFGYFTALRYGFLIMLGALTAGALSSSLSAQVLVMVFTAIGMCLTWPALEALVCEGETPANLQHMVGLYNVIWAGTG